LDMAASPHPWVSRCLLHCAPCSYTASPSQVAATGELGPGVAAKTWPCGRIEPFPLGLPTPLFLTL
jgi:hypothetical protein